MAVLKNRAPLLFIALLLVGLPLSKMLVHLLTDIWWFNTVGFAEVFWTRITWQVLIWMFTFGVYSLFLWFNYRFAMRQTRQSGFLVLVGTEFEGLTEAFFNASMALLIGVIAFIAANTSVPAWEPGLKFLCASGVGTPDPIFQRDLSFYLFRLPFYEGLWHWCFVLLLGGLAFSTLVYTLKGRFSNRVSPYNGHRRHRWPIGVKAHWYSLLAAIALFVALHFWLNRYRLLFTSHGAIFGAGFTDVHARLLAYGVMSALAIGLALCCILAIWRSARVLLAIGLSLFGSAYVLLNLLYPWMQQTLLVEPNELAKEKPYLAHNIEFTQRAYHLHDVQRETYTATAQLNQQVLQANPSTLNNIRLWDYRPLLSTYRQLQEIRLYYRFYDVDVDRYTLNNTYQQVMLSARELDANQLPQEARTWVNQRLKYTHGYGLVMSPVNRVTADGLPELYIKDIPPVTAINLPIQQPALYYGEVPSSYIFTGTATEEFDYPLGDTNAFTTYRGKGGVPIPSIGHRLAYAYDLGSLQILLSNYFTAQSRIHYYRQIRERVRQVTPFLRLDGDPYLVVIKGRLQWIVDAYTVSDHYPYAEPVQDSREFATIAPKKSIQTLIQGRVNYIRNSVKVLIDAYDGSLQYFAVDETDPVLQTYRAIFPNLVLPKEAVPPEVKAHFRYPQDLFAIQAQMYQAYHMSDPQVFYNREDLWRFPLETYEGNQVVMEPYYMIIRLPGETQEGFILILPFTPVNKDNMIAWLAARSNGQEYGKLLLYEFPKQKLVFGPRQIEARIDQDPKISQQFTLWSQAGSKVIRGNLLVIPLAQSLLYVEPVYLRAEQGELPELKRVIVAYDKAIVMTETLEQALAGIFGGVLAEQGQPTVLTGDLAGLVQSALKTYQNAETAARQGNWADYGRYQQELKAILQQLNQKSAGSKPLK
jgi:hypothetical protein